MAQLKTTKISIFKNGSYFLLKEGEVKVKNNQFLMDIPEHALMGTFWINAGNDNRVKMISLRDDTVKKNATIESTSDMLKASIGKNVTLRYMHSKDLPVRELSGQLMSYNHATAAIKIKGGDGKITFATATNLIEVTSDITSEKFSADSVYRMMRVSLTKNNDTKINYMAMQTGMNWQPQYVLKLINDKDARLEMKALIENFSEEIKDADVNLVVGSPQMRYGLTMDPLTNNYLTNVYQPQYGNSNNYMYQNAAPSMAKSMVAEGDASVVGGGQEYSTEGEKNSDLYFYRTGNIDLPKNSKSIIYLASQQVDFQDVYDAVLYDHVNYCNTRNIYNDPNQKFEVYHSVKFKNSTPAPITTAPIFVVSQLEDPLAQDEISYTPVGSEASVKLSKAIDVELKNTEEEVSREDNAKRINKTVYTKVILKGTINAANFQDKKITLNLKKNVQGEVTASDGGKVTKTRSGYHGALNPNSEVKWDISLGANEKKVITYTYEVWLQVY